MTDASKLAKDVLTQGKPDLLKKSPDQMVRRVCRELGSKKNIIVINDEAHHCYRRRQEGAVEVKLTGEDRTEAEQREEEARIWISGIEAVKRKLGVKVVYDLSATPFFLRGSGYLEGTLFPWVVSDFSLIDAIESGIVKVPRVPVADDAMTGELPTFRDLWQRIREALPRKGRAKEEYDGEPKLPTEPGSRAGHVLPELRAGVPALGTQQRGAAQRPDAAGLHRRLQQHERLEAGLQLHRRLGEEAIRWQDVCPGTRPAAALQQRARRPVDGAAKRDPRG